MKATPINSFYIYIFEFSKTKNRMIFDIKVFENFVVKLLLIRSDSLAPSVNKKCGSILLPQFLIAPRALSETVRES
jgi:hypothetical protein